MGPVGIIFAALGTALSAIGGISAANAQARQADAAAQIEAIQAREAKIKSQEEARLERRRINLLKGKQRATYAHGGVSVEEGTPLVIEADTEQEGQRSIDLILRAGTVESAVHQANAANLRSQAKSTKTAGLIGGLATVLGGAGKIAGMKSSPNFHTGFNATISQPGGHT